MDLSIVIPALNEADCIEETLKSTKHGDCVERIVVDGGSDDETRSIVRRHGARYILSEPGRGRQLRRGMEASTGDTMLFLHADSHLPVDYHRYVDRILSVRDVSGGAFQLSIRGGPAGIGIVEGFVQFRSRVFQMPYGDQAIFARRDTVERVGGVPLEPIMEDVLLIRRLRRAGRIGLADAAVRTSGRRWRERGIVFNTLQNQVILLAFQLGVSPQTLWSLYHG